MNGVNVEDEGDILPPTIREVKDAIKLLRNEAAGKDGVGAKVLEMSPNKLVTCLHQLLVRFWQPKGWNDRVICPRKGRQVSV